MHELGITRRILEVALDRAADAHAARITAVHLEIGEASDVAPESISLYWLATRADGHFLANQCRAWTDALDNFDHALFTDTDMNAGARSVVQGMRADLFVADCDFYLAGPEMFVDTAAAELRSAGVPERQIFTMFL